MKRRKSDTVRIERKQMHELHRDSGIGKLKDAARPSFRERDFQQRVAEFALRALIAPSSTIQDVHGVIHSGSPMTDDQFRRLALELPGAAESSHMSHPDFRVRNKIFATLGYPDRRWGMVKLTPDQQGELLGQALETFQPAAGAWGRSGSTLVLLSAIKEADLRPILERAWKNIAARKTRRKKHPPL